MRGKVGGISRQAKNSRITPAHAGKSRPLSGRADGAQDHPRPCGEKFCACALALTVVGSPPPMRGKVTLSQPGSAWSGITPAHAGKSIIGVVVCIPHVDHPRPCGEKAYAHPARFAIPGSPPPMRGKAAGTARHLMGVGITPAHAGKSPRFKPPCKNGEDHPRPCGEKYLIGVVGAVVPGSPPPMRGKARIKRRAWRMKWITPAHAGKSFYMGRACARAQDHPRPCGEKFDCEIQRTRLIGSPPPMRGKGLIFDADVAAFRITPAHAGKSRPSS